MEEFLDNLWLKMEVVIHYIRVSLDFVLTPLNHLGPAVAIFAIALLTVVAAKFFSSRYKSKRFIELEKEFLHWYNVRQEALKCKDAHREKVKLLTKNIDQAKLNRVYYDYFLEGLLSNVLTTYMPIVFLLAYVNEAYNSSNLLRLFHREYIFKFTGSSGKPVFIGAAFWFVISVVMVYLGWYVTGKLYSRYATKKGAKPVGKNYPGAALPGEEYRRP